ncbi:hypothetical protein TomTYG75_30370 [Sphingobium sp. TomTYG75]
MAGDGDGKLKAELVEEGGLVLREPGNQHVAEFYHQLAIVGGDDAGREETGGGAALNAMRFAFEEQDRLARRTADPADLFGQETGLPYIRVTQDGARFGEIAGAHIGIDGPTGVGGCG